MLPHTLSTNRWLSRDARRRQSVHALSARGRGKGGGPSQEKHLHRNIPTEENEAQRKGSSNMEDKSVKTKEERQS